MQRYILRRLFQAVIVLFGISIIVFSLVRISGDPSMLMAGPGASDEQIEQYRELLGLNKPIYVQYWLFISGVLQGDFGESIKWGKPTLYVFMQRLPNTLLLTLGASIWSYSIGLVVGLLSAVRVGRWVDNIGKTFALLGQAMPTFWLGLMLMLIFATTLRWLPTSGIGGFAHLLMPSFTLGWYFSASMTRMTRSAMLDVLDSEYIKMARIKGMPEKRVILRHAFKNASIPVLTLGAMQLTFMVMGTVVTEQVFNWPGVGRLVVDSITSRDYPMVQACVLIFAALYVIVNLVVDISYAYIDPRIRYD
jgi:ABC-type dipeptide/oligopeptide/nickel transport system permease component